MSKQKNKIIAAAVAFVLLITAVTAEAYSFPEPDWGALYNERLRMATETEFELYAEGSLESAPFYGAKFEPRGGTYLGTIPDGSSALLPVGSYLTYIDNMNQSDLYISHLMNDDVTSLVGWTVDNLDTIDYDHVRNVLGTLNGYGKPLFIRFGNEMNCSSLGDDPDKYVSVFRTVADMIHEYDNLAVVWSPNDFGALDRPFQYYYPGDDYVDWVGVSCYIRKEASFEGASERDYVYFMFGDYSWSLSNVKPFMEFLREYGINKPVMISEGGVETSGRNGNVSESWSASRLRNMLWYVVMKYPQIKMINYFDKHIDYEKSRYDISGYDYAVSIFKEAASNGAYITRFSQPADFVFQPANNAGTLKADNNNTVRIYTLAFSYDRPDISVSYSIDGQWYHSSSIVPYTCAINLSQFSDGCHTLEISDGVNSRSYDMYKRGKFVSFGSEPDTTSSGDADSEKITVKLNGTDIAFDQPPVVINGRTLVPLRAVFEAMGASVDWNQETSTVTSKKGNITISLSTGSSTMYRNGIPITLDVPSQVINDRTLVPVRAVSEAFGADVDWDNDTWTVIIRM